MKIYLLCLLLSGALLANQLQSAIDKAPTNSKIELGAGVYKGNIVIEKPLILEGKAGAKIVGEGVGSVITVKSSNVIIKGLSISSSGSNHEGIDAAIKVENANNVEISHNNISDCLFGINFEKVTNSKIEANHITSKPYDLGVRGDGIVLWYSSNNLISQNTLFKSRDLVAWYSSKNIFEKNSAQFGRYSLHFMYSVDSIVRDNFFANNSVGIFFMYSSRFQAYNNTVRNAIGTFGLGLGMTDCSDFTIEDNNIVYNARGVYFDQTPYQPDSVNIFRRNKILYNSQAVQLQGLREKLLIEENTFQGNLELITSDMPKRNSQFIEWQRNFWDDYEGYDKDKNGVGDIPYKHYLYADRLWLYNANIRFFYGSVAMDLLNFLSRLAPFSEPELLAQDNEPLMRIEQ